jgi:predicted MFS family arabinose efflux permease
MRLSLLTVLTFFTMSSGLYLVFTYYLQTGLGIAPATAGLMFVPLGFTFALGSAACRRLGHRVRVPLPVAGTALVTTVLYGGALVAQLPRDVQPPLLVAMIALAGFGQGLVVAPLVAGILSRVTPSEAGAASGMATTVTQVGLAIGVAVAGVCYRTILGATPGDPGVPFADHAPAFTITALLLAGLAMVTSLLSARLHALPPHEPAVVPAERKEAVTAATN